MREVPDPKAESQTLGEASSFDALWPMLRDVRWTHGWSGQLAAPEGNCSSQAEACDASLFAREDAVEAAWAVVEPVLGDAVPLRRYRPETWGPEQARDLMARHGGWRDPNPGQARTA